MKTLRTLILLLLLIGPIFLFGQIGLNQPQISMDYGIARLTTGDFTGFQNHNSYKIPLNKFLSIEPGISITFGSARAVVARPTLDNATYQSKDNTGPTELGPPFLYRPDVYDDGFISFNPHLDKSLYVSTDIKLTAGLYSSKQMAEISIGPSLAYIDHSYYMANAQGVFDSKVVPPVELTLVQALYHRFLDYGFVVDLSYNYKLTEHFGLGLRISTARYKEKDTILSSSLSLSFTP